MSENEKKPLLIATIGHLDHGRTSLAAAVIRALALAPSAKEIAQWQEDKAIVPKPKRETPAPKKRAFNR